ncbi:MAG TPA: hypothetical protein VF596_11750 [Pyrinomonadaceae bacterium]|jgi:hypothetical protein
MPRVNFDYQIFADRRLFNAIAASIKPKPNLFFGSGAYQATKLNLFLSMQMLQVKKGTVYNIFLL